MYSSLHFDSRISNAFGRKEPGPVRGLAATPDVGQGYLPGSYGSRSRMTAYTTWHSFLATAVTATLWGLPSRLFFS